MYTKTYQIMLPFFFMYWNLWSDSTTCRRITVFYCDQVNIYFKSVFHLFWTPINAGCEIFGQKVNCLEHILFIKWKHFPRYWPFLRRIHRSPVDSPHKGQWHGALMFSLICAWTNSWATNGDAGDVRRHCTHYDVIVMNLPDALCVNVFVGYINVLSASSSDKTSYRIRYWEIKWHAEFRASVVLNALNTLSPRQDGRYFADDIFTCIFLNENVWISINISVKFVPKGQINNIPALVQVMTWRRPGDKPLSEPLVVRLPTHILDTLPQWV